MKTRRWVAPLLAASCACATEVALAGTVLVQERQGTSVRTMTVHYGDLNLSTTAGASTLYQRLRGAARDVCGETSEKGLDAQHDWDLCFHTALDSAVDKVHSPLLNALNHRNAPAATATAMLSH